MRCQILLGIKTLINPVGISRYIVWGDVPTFFATLWLLAIVCQCVESQRRARPCGAPWNASILKIPFTSASAPNCVSSSSPSDRGRAAVVLVGTAGAA